jgi:15-cis-phytoene synthase
MRLAGMVHDDAGHCQQIVRAHARTFWLASRFLPPPKRRAAFALYAFCRIADDLVDLGKDDPAGVGGRLAAYRADLEATLAGEPRGPVFRELALAAREYHVPTPVLRELLDGVGRDCAPADYDTWDDLSRYCEGVASSVGEMCTYVFGVVGDVHVRERAIVHARTLGTAMQLTNILRDVGEDARAGRCYLPLEDLDRFGVRRDAILAGDVSRDARWTALMQFEIGRARSLYACALPGIGLLSADSRRCAAACAVGYAGILGAIERIAYDTLTTRARLSTAERASVLWQAWRTPLGNPVQPAPHEAPRGDGSMVHWA